VGGTAIALKRGDRKMEALDGRSMGRELWMGIGKAG
jgi:hypothetical protein